MNQPIAPGSEEWKSHAGQTCIQQEKEKHERRGTCNLKPLINLQDLNNETNRSGEGIVIGGIHPILYKKHADDPRISVNRCRVVYNAPRANTTQSGLNVHTLYNEISSAPVTFQGARASRAIGAPKGFVTSTRDAMEAYLLANIRRKAPPRTFIALPSCFWPRSALRLNAFDVSLVVDLLRRLNAFDVTPDFVIIPPPVDYPGGWICFVRRSARGGANLGQHGTSTLGGGSVRADGFPRGGSLL